MLCERSSTHYEAISPFSKFPASTSVHCPPWASVAFLRRLLPHYLPLPRVPARPRQCSHRLKLNHLPKVDPSKSKCSPGKDVTEKAPQTRRPAAILKQHHRLQGECGEGRITAEKPCEQKNTDNRREGGIVQGSCDIVVDGYVSPVATPCRELTLDARRRELSSGIHRRSGQDG